MDGWNKLRNQYINLSLDIIKKPDFLVCLKENNKEYIYLAQQSELTQWNGKQYDVFNLIESVMLKLDSALQHVLSMDPIKLGYTEEGHCRGEPHPNLPGPQRLQWDIAEEVKASLCSKFLQCVVQLRWKAKVFIVVPNGHTQR